MSRPKNTFVSKSVTVNMPVTLIDAIYEHQAMMSLAVGGANIPFSQALMHLIKEGLNAFSEQHSQSSGA